MRVIHVLVLVTLLYSCSPKTYVYIADKYKFGALLNGLPEKDSLITVHFGSGSIKVVGKLAITTDSLLSNIKAGYWKEFYENGNLKCEGNYKISSFLNCGVGGPFLEYYSYKTGIWNYYNKQGDLAYDVAFVPTKQRIKTNCEGGDSLTFGLIKNVPLKYNTELTPDIIYKLQQVTIKEGNTAIIYTPLNGEVFVTFEPDLDKSKL